MEPAAGRRLLMIEQGGRGGVTDYTDELTRALVAEGWSVTLATAADHTYPPVPGIAVKGVFRYVRDDSAIGGALRRRGLGKLINGLYFLAALPRLMRLARAADIVHSQGWEIPQIGLLAVLCLRFTGTPVVQTAHGTFERAESFLRTRRLVRRLTGRLLRKMIVHTEADRVRVRAWVGERSLVIPHGEYGGLASKGGGADRGAARAALGVPAEASATLMFGQLRTDKGLDELIAAVELVPETHLLIGGKEAGALAAVREHLDDPRLSSRVTLREGFLDMRETAELFAAADTVALPYRAASQSGVLLLAYGFARPVIIYPAGGMVEAVIDGETGWICSDSSVEALAAALRESARAGHEECARRGQRGRELAGERYSWPVIARRTSALYEEVLSDV
jgi:glycosyltransferase involved in cell wall biosynthesis